ncbi:MAG: cob(I)yrinic acid a,c-diamide adenosyltransferase [Actinomycetota bacterium]|jgi:cob(I)alamin adenosyltransferase|nr:cob(I)yrinic acid a,c-diamide adenosyltransferase [Acidimicrobiia bacterium]MDQ3601095.1 cob(I)yrinic acid a,c-diamide adenosyltransferase [Actinomycetota bacterium]
MTDEPEADTTDDTAAPPTEDPVRAELRRAPSVVLVNTGDGKGKSTAAFGVMVRAIARGWNVAVCQFIKSGDWKVGEEKLGRELGVTWHALGDGFTWDSNDLEADRARAGQAWAVAGGIIEGGEHQVVVLDELTYLCSWGWLDTQDVVEAITNRPEHVNIVITGRDAPKGLIDVADTVTEMRHVKHAYDQGVRAMRGIDY